MHKANNKMQSVWAMIDLEKLQANINTDIMQMLEFMKSDTNINTGAIQEACEWDMHELHGIQIFF